ncbi:isochorismatase family cysteine hydrolase [Chloroflexota bacterium]
MREIHGKLLYDSIEEVVHPSHTALVVVDMQNDTCSPDGARVRRGSGITAIQKIIEPLGALIEAARLSGVRIVYLMQTIEQNLASAAPAWIYYCYRKRPVSGAPRMPLEVRVEGTWGHQIIPDLAPEPSDFIIKKNRPSGFTSTNLDKILRANGIESTVVAGIITAGCVLATARDAQFHDYYTVVVKDCVADNDPKMHEVGITLLSDRCDVLCSKELITLWANALIE